MFVEVCFVLWNAQLDLKSKKKWQCPILMAVHSAFQVLWLWEKGNFTYFYVLKYTLQPVLILVGGVSYIFLGVYQTKMCISSSAWSLL